MISIGWWQTRISAQASITISSPCKPLLPATIVDDMVTVLNQTFLSTAANLAPPIEHKQGVGGWCATEEAKAEMHSKWQEREDAKKRLHAAPNDRILRKTLKVAECKLERARAATVLRFFDYYVSQLEGCNRKGDQLDFHKHPNGMDLSLIHI